MKQLPKILLAFLILAIGICLTFWIHFLYKRAVLSKKENQITNIIEDKFSNLQHEISSGVASVEILGYLIEDHIEDQEIVSKEVFKNYIAPIFKGNPAIKALSWVPKITDKNRAAYESNLSANNHDFTITEITNQNKKLIRTKQNFYFPVTYIEPVIENINALGFDIYSENVRKQTINYAIAHNRLTLTSRIKIIQDTLGYGYLGILPVYNAPLKEKTIDNVKGLISAVFKVDKLVDQALKKSTDATIAVVIFDITNNNRACIYGDETPFITQKLQVQKKFINFGSRTWEINFFISAIYFSEAESLTFLWGGLLFSFLLFLLLLYPYFKEKKFQILNIKFYKEQKLREETEKDLSQSKELFRTLFEYIPDGIFIATPKGNYLEVNTAATKLLGYSHDELIRLNVCDIVIDSEISRITRELESATKAPLINREWIFKRKDQSTFIGVVYSTLLPNGNLLGILKDITDRKLAENNLLQYEHIVSGSTDMLALLDKNYVYLAVNNSFAVHFGKSIAEIVGKTPEQLFGKETFITVIKPHADKCLKGETVNYKKWFDFANQQRLYMDVYYHPYYNEVQEIVGFIVNARDITAQYLAELEVKKISSSWQATFNAMTDSVCLIDLDHKITQYNQATLTMFNLNAESFKDKHCHDLVHCSLEPYPDCPFVRMKISHLNETMEFFQNNHWYKVTVDPIFDADKNLIGGVHVVSDITKRKEIEILIKKQKEQYDSLVQNIPIGIYKFKKNTNGAYVFDYVSPIFLEMGGLTETAVYNNYMNAFKMIHPEELDNFILKNDEANTNKKPFLWEGRIVVDNKISWIKIESKPAIQENGEIIWDGIVADITTRKESELALQKSNQTINSLIDNAYSLVYIFNLNGEFLLVNKNFEKLLGIPKDKLIGFKREKFFPKEISEQHHQNDLKVIHSKQAISFEETNIEADGIHYYLTSKFPLFDSEGEIYAVGGISTDITKLKKAEEELKESESRYRCLFESAKDGILILDAESGMIVDVNPFLIKLLGYSHEVFLQKKIWEVGLFKDIVANKDNFLELQQNEYIRYRDLPLETFDGHIIHVEFVSNVYLVDNTKVIQCNIRDISEKKQALDELHASEAHFKHMFNANPQAMWIYDKENLRFLDVNDTAIKKYGYSKETFLTMTLKDIRPPKDVSLLLKNVSESKDEIQHSGTWRHQLKDGTIIFVEINSHDFDFEERPARLVIVNDITQQKLAESKLKESEARLNLFFKQSLDGFFFMMLDKPIVWNDTIDKEKTLDYVFKHQHITKVNQAILDQYKATEDQFLNITPNEVFKHDLKYGRKIWKDFFDKGQIHIDTNEKKFDGTDMIIEGDYVCLYDAESRIIGHFAIQRDITEARQNRDQILKHNSELETKVAERTAQLEFTNNELKDFAQVVSHDLKAPLRAISQLSYWVSQDYADKIDEEGKIKLNLIMSRAKRLDNLIGGILQYSRAGKSLEKKVKINFNTLINDCIKALNPPKNIKITIDNKLPNYKADQTRMLQLFQNLITNAIKYNDKPQGDIHIGCKTKEGFYEFYVSDNGIGIEEQYFERIFQIFQRLESRDVQEGTGVGLSLVKRIVQIYGGDVSLSSKIGEGSTFFFTLPIINKLV